MEWQQLEYFQCVARMEHMTRASQMLSVSQSALSRSISRMEAELGVPLFDRERRSIRLNRYGQMFLKRVQCIMKEYEDGKREIRSAAGEEDGEVVLGFLHTLGSRRIPDLIGAFRAQSPGVRFQLHQNGNFSLVHQLTQGSIDLCLLSSPEGAALPLEWKELWSEELFVFVPDGHPLAGRESIDLQEIAQEPMVTFKKGYGLRKIVDRLCMEAGFIPGTPFEGEEVLTVAGLAAAGLGVALLPEVPGLGSLPLAKLPVNSPECRRVIGAAWVRDRELPPPAKRFLSYVIDYFQQPEETVPEPRSSAGKKRTWPPR